MVTLTNNTSYFDYKQIRTTTLSATKSLAYFFSCFFSRYSKKNRIFAGSNLHFMTPWLRNIATAFVLLSFGGSLSAQRIDPNDSIRISLSGRSIVTAVPFLLISPDARSGAMGDVGAASSPDINSQHWNAAKYPFIRDRYGMSVTYSPWLRTLVPDMNLLYLAGYYRVDDLSAFAGSLRFFSLGTVHFRESSDDPGIPYNPNEYAIDLSYSRKLSEHFSLAVTGRYIRSDLTQGYSGTGASRASPANSGAADVSMYYARDLKALSGTEGSSFALGMNISNIGAKLSYSQNLDAKDFLPANLRLGGAYTLQVDRHNEVTVLLDFNKLLVPTPQLRDTSASSRDPKEMEVMESIFSSFSDAPGGFSEEMREIYISAGLEYWYNQTFAVRGGYFHENKYKGGRQYFTLGAGLRFNVFEIDFSYLLPSANNATNPLKNTLRFTLKFNFSEYMSRQSTTPSSP